jgi:hypothetical protein
VPGAQSKMSPICYLDLESVFTMSSPIFSVVPHDTSFSDIWFGAHAREVRKTIREAPASLSFCQNCPFVDRPTSSCSLESHLLRPFEP